MRERGYVLPKPAGVLRVVLSGDSFVFGYGATAEHRVGAYLREMLQPGDAGASVEVLHVGISSWDVIAECAYLRRQLSLLQPDVVLHFTNNNDLDDVAGVRGFGAMSVFSPRDRARAGTLVTAAYATRLGFSTFGPLEAAIDHEGRTRYAAAEAAISRLARAVEQGGGRYCMIGNWRGHNAVARAELAANLRADQFAFVANAWAGDSANWVNEQDAHWGAQGAGEMAEAVHELLRRRRLLPPALVPERSSSAPSFEAIFAAAEHESAGPPESAEERGAGIQSRVDLPLDAAAARHVYAGLAVDGAAEPLVVMVLACAGATALELGLERLPRPELDGAVSVSVEGIEIGHFSLQGPPRESIRFALPVAVVQRPFVSVALQAGDWCYALPDLQQLVSYRLRHVALGE